MSHPSEKYEFVNWDDGIPNISGNIKHVPNHQPDIQPPFSYGFPVVFPIVMLDHQPVNDNQPDNYGLIMYNNDDNDQWYLLGMTFYIAIEKMVFPIVIC